MELGQIQLSGAKGSTVVRGRIGTCSVAEELMTNGTDDLCEWWLVCTSTICNVDVLFC